MSEHEKTGKIGISALKAGMHPQTARKYLQAGQGPEELKQAHTWRTRPDPLEGIWKEVQRMLEDAPELEAKALFEHFLERPESGLEEKHLRTFQRRVAQWRALNGPAREVFFAQDRQPGRLMQLDWTYARELGVSIQGEPLDHLFCHCVLPYSNWQWATRCVSESFLSLVSGLQAALGRLGRVPKVLCTDNSSAATHEIEQTPGRPRGYNSDFLELCTHYDLSPMTIHVGCPHEQGDVESQNRHLKRRLNQHLTLRGSRDFASLEAYDRFVGNLLQRANDKRHSKVAEELACMRPLPPGQLAEYRELEAVVSSQSLIRVKKVAYSVPSRLIGRRVRIHLHEAHLRVHLGREFLFELPRLRGDRGALVDFRHVVEPLLRKPGAFTHYRHRQALFPGLEFRQAHDRLEADHGTRLGVLEYLRLLKLAADMGLDPVRELLPQFLAQKTRWTVRDLRQRLQPEARQVVELEAPRPTLGDYDALLEGEVDHAG